MPGSAPNMDLDLQHSTFLPGAWLPGDTFHTWAMNYPQAVIPSLFLVRYPIS